MAKPDKILSDDIFYNIIFSKLFSLQIEEKDKSPISTKPRHPFFLPVEAKLPKGEPATKDEEIWHNYNAPHTLIPHLF
jgi:hypothetical protein